MSHVGISYLASISRNARRPRRFVSLSLAHLVIISACVNVRSRDRPRQLDYTTGRRQERAILSQARMRRKRVFRRLKSLKPLLRSAIGRRSVGDRSALPSDRLGQSQRIIIRNVKRRSGKGIYLYTLRQREEGKAKSRNKPGAIWKYSYLIFG